VTAEQSALWWPLLVYFVAVLALVASMIGLSYVLGQRHQERATGDPYESGMLATGSARLRFSANFYLVAVFFVIFDLEVVFIIAWAIAVRELGWTGYLGVLVFIGVLVAGLLYEWRQGALDWLSPAPQRRPTRLVPASRREEDRRERREEAGNDAMVVE
jgi:NADH-quinone oxidoreductase subunit A